MFDSLKTAALAYASWGWPVMPCNWMEGSTCSCGDPECRSPGKHPLATLVPRGLHQASTDQLVVEAWWEAYPKANVAIRTGHGLCVVDLDVKATADGFATIKEWERRNVAFPKTLVAHTGGGGMHVFFSYDPATRIPSRTNVLGPGVDVRADGGYVLAPASNHKSGKTYEWDGTLGPYDIGPAPMPPELLAALTGGIQRENTTTSETPTTGGQVIPLDQVDEILSALAAIPADDRDTWLQVGMALESTRGGEQAYKLWEDWSKTSPKFDPRDQRRVWRSFRPDHGVTLSTIFWMARGRGWVEPIPTTPITVDEAALCEVLPPPTVSLPPEDVLNVPGVLGDFVRWANATAPMIQPQFSVQAALALGAVVAGRCWVTNQRNHAALYLLNIGPSGCGKEHAKFCATQVLTLAGQSRLINGAGYTSDGAVYSSLLDRPAHLTVIDEIGLMLEGAKARGNHVGASALKVLMEAWGACHGVMIPKQYSNMTLTPEQREKVGAKIIHNPCLTILGLTTSRQFYDAISGKEVANGFLNRWLICETAYDLGEEQEVQNIEPPQTVVDWVREVRKSRGNIPVHDLSLQPAAPTVMPFAQGALDVFRAYSSELRERREALKADGLEELLSRCKETAMRISLVVALSDGQREGGAIQAHHAQWAVNYVRHYTERLLSTVAHTVSDSAHEATQKAFLTALRKAGSKGVSASEMCRRRPFSSVGVRQRKEILTDLVENGVVVSVATPGTHKKPRVNFLLSEFFNPSGLQGEFKNS